MKRMSRVISTLALLLMALGTAPTANAALLARSLNFTAPDQGGFPTWYQDQNSLALQPCLDTTTPGNPCGLLAEPGFNPAQPVSFPNNFPSEVFYYMADTGSFPVGGAGVSAFVILAIEGTFALANGTLVDPATPGALPIVFQRMRVRIDPAQGTVTQAGNYTVTHPFGTHTFPCETGGNNSACTFTIDLPVINPLNFDGALGIGEPNTMTTFLQQTAPLPPAGFIGDGASLGPVTGGPVGNTFTVSGPPGTGSTSNFIVVGKKIGMDVQPGTTLDLGKVIMPATSVPKTVTITNTTANLITIGTTVAGADPTEFVFNPPAAAGAVFCGPTAVLAPLGTCSIDFTFTPSNTKPVPTAARVVTIILTPTNTPAVVGASDPPPVTLNLSGTAQVKITIPPATLHGAIAPGATVDPIIGSLVDFAAPAGSPVTFTVIPSNTKFKVKEVSDVAGANAAVPVAAPFTINTGAADHTVTATFMPSGDLDADGMLGVNDALKALKIVAGVQIADVDDPDNSAVKVAPLVGGVPAALNAKATPDIGDVLVILRRVLGLDTW